MQGGVRTQSLDANIRDKSDTTPSFALGDCELVLEDLFGCHGNEKHVKEQDCCYFQINILESTVEMPNISFEIMQAAMGKYPH